MALEKFMKTYFEKAWSKYDMYSRGQIDMIEVVPFVRDLMTSMSDVRLASETSTIKKEVPVLDVDPIVEPDTPSPILAAAHIPGPPLPPPSYEKYSEGKAIPSPNTPVSKSPIQN
jgi:hypothetical protein